MQFDVRKLQLGDFLWVARERTTPTPGTSLQSSVFCVKHVCVWGGGAAGGEEVLCLRNFVLPYSYFFIMKMLGTS